MTLGVIVLFALVTLFVNNSRMRRETDQASQQIENGRYALDLLRDDLHLSGYYGDSVPQTGYTVATATIPDMCATTVAGLQFVAPPAALQWPVPVFGIAGGDAVPTCVSSATGGQKAGTDILVVRRTSTLPTAGGLTAGKGLRAGHRLQDGSRSAQAISSSIIRRECCQRSRRTKKDCATAGRHLRVPDPNLLRVERDDPDAARAHDFGDFVDERAAGPGHRGYARASTDATTSATTARRMRSASASQRLIRASRPTGQT